MSYASSFGSAGFDTQMDGFGYAATSVLSERHMPGGSTTIIDLAGQGLNKISLRAFFTSFSDFLSLAAQRNTQATLTWFNGTNSAVLANVSQAAPLSPASPYVCTAQLDFDLTS